MEELAPIIIEMPDMSDKSLDVAIDHARLMGRVLFDYLGKIYELRLENLESEPL
jgi:hypothetical protein